MTIMDIYNCREEWRIELTGFRVSPCWKIKKLSNRKIEYQFLRRIPIQNCTIAYDIVNRDSNEKQVFKAGDNNVM